MSRSSALITLGVLTVLAPLSGLPQSWITFILALLGIAIVLMGISLRSEHARRMRDTAFVPPTLPTPPTDSEPAPHHGPSSMA